MKEVELQDVVEIIAGQSPKSEFYNESGEGVPFFQGKTDFGDNYPTITTWCTKPKKMAKKGDILFSVRAPVGPTNIAKVDCCIGRGLSAIRPGEKIDRSYLRYFFKKVEEKISDQGRGSTFKAITQKDLKALKIPLPSLSEQKAIVAKLDRAQRLIDIDREMLGKYDELIQGVFLEMFGDDLKEKKNEKTLNQVAKFIDYRGQSPDKAEDGIPLITAKNVKEGFLNEEPKEYMNENSFEDWMTRGVPKPGDVLFTTEAPMGNACIIPDINKFAIAQRLICFQLNNELIAEYLLNYLLSDLAKFEFEKRATGSTAKGIGSTKLKKVPVVIPDLDKQKHYRSIYRKIISEKKVIKQSLKKSGELFSTLVQGFFS